LCHGLTWIQGYLVVLVAHLVNNMEQCDGENDLLAERGKLFYEELQDINVKL